MRFSPGCCCGGACECVCEDTGGSSYAFNIPGAEFWTGDRLVFFNFSLEGSGPCFQYEGPPPIFGGFQYVLGLVQPNDDIPYCHWKLVLTFNGAPENFQASLDDPGEFDMFWVLPADEWLCEENNTLERGRADPEGMTFDDEVELTYVPPP